jgi:hypothetical protein
MRRSLVALVVFAAALMSVPAQANAVGAGCGGFCSDSGSVGTYDGGLITHLGDWSAPSQLPTSRPVVQPTGPLVQSDYSPVCDGECHSLTAQRLFGFRRVPGH